MNPTLTIARREFKSYFDSPSPTGRHLPFALDARRGRLHLPASSGRSTGPRFVDVEAIRPARPSHRSGRHHAPRREEKRSGTLEMLITCRFATATSSSASSSRLRARARAVLSTALYPLLMSSSGTSARSHRTRWFSGYFGLILFSAAAVALGLFHFERHESQVIAFSSPSSRWRSSTSWASWRARAECARNRVRTRASGAHSQFERDSSTCAMSGFSCRAPRWRSSWPFALSKPEVDLRG